MFKLHPRHGESGLCVGCEHGQVMQFVTGEDVIMCNNLMRPFRVMKAVTQCTDFSDRTHENEYEMRKIAWTISTDKRGRLGFEPPKKKDD